MIALVAAFATPTLPFAATVSGGSGILSASDANQLESWLGEGSVGLTAIFSKSSTSTSYDFHAAADGKGRTFTVIELDNGNVVGGYNPFGWSSTSSYVYAYDTGAFLFNLTTGTKYDQMASTSGSRSVYVTYNSATYGPTFGGGHDLYVNTSLSRGYANIGHTYGDPNRYYSENYRNEFTGSYNDWTIKKLDVFTIGPAATPVPIPAGLPLLLTALGGLGFMVRRKSKSV